MRKLFLALAILAALPAFAGSQVVNSTLESGDVTAQYTQCKCEFISTDQAHTGSKSVKYYPGNCASACTSAGSPTRSGGCGGGTCTNGDPGCSTNDNCDVAMTGGPTAWYLSYWIYLGPSFDGREGSGRHLWRFWVSQASNKQFDTGMFGDDGATARFGIDYLLGGYSPESGEGPCPTITSCPHKRACDLQKGQWNRIEVQFYAGTPGGTDGKAMMWCTNGAGTVSPWPGNGGATETGKSYVNGGGSSAFTAFSLATNYDGYVSGPGTSFWPNTAAGDVWYIDDVIVWKGTSFADACPPTGASCSTAPAVLPSTVTGVRLTGVRL